MDFRRVRRVTISLSLFRNSTGPREMRDRTTSLAMIDGEESIAESVWTGAPGASEVVEATVCSRSPIYTRAGDQVESMYERAHGRQN